MGALFRKAEMAANGVVSEWQGRPVDPRYHSRAATIIDWPEITPAEMREGGLRVLVDQDRARQLTAERVAAHRRRQGVVERSSYEAASLEQAKPWEAEGISRRSWYRRRKPAGTGV